MVLVSDFANFPYIKYHENIMIATQIEGKLFVSDILNGVSNRKEEVVSTALKL